LRVVGNSPFRIERLMTMDRRRISSYSRIGTWMPRLSGVTNWLINSNSKDIIYSDKYKHFSLIRYLSARPSHTSICRWIWNPSAKLEIASATGSKMRRKFWHVSRNLSFLIGHRSCPVS